MSKLLKTLLRTGVYLLDQAEDATAVVRGRVRNHVEDLTGRATEAIYGREDHTLRNVVTFVVGIGIGVGVGLLVAPASGEQTREVLSEKLQGLGENVRGRFSREGKRQGTGTEG